MLEASRGERTSFEDTFIGLSLMSMLLEISRLLASSDSVLNVCLMCDTAFCVVCWLLIDILRGKILLKRHLFTALVSINHCVTDGTDAIQIIVSVCILHSDKGLMLLSTPCPTKQYICRCCAAN